MDSQRFEKFDNIAGIQVVNEAEFSDPAKKQSTYYAACITEIRKSDSLVPVIISDGWWADQWVKWVQEKQGPDGNIGVVLDEHVYRCFSDDDKNKTPQQIIDDLNGDLLTNLTDDGKGWKSLLVSIRVCWMVNPGIMIKRQS